MRRLPVALVPAGVALGVAAEWASYDTGELDLAIADLLAGWALLGCGLVAWSARRESRVGPLMAATGVAWFLGSFVPGALYVHRGPLVHLLLSYPTGRLTRRRDRVVVVAAYIDGAIEALARSPVVTLALCASIAVAAIAAYLGEAGPRRRVRLVPAVGATAVGLVLGFGAVARLAGWDAGAATLLVYEIVLAAIAAGLLADLLRGRWSQAAVTGLVVDLGGLWEPVTLRDRLARALGDSSLQLGYWLADEQRYIDERGRSFSLPGDGADRAVTPVDRGGEHVAVLVHDPSILDDDPALAEAVAAATRIAVVNARLRAEVGARVEQLAASHRRIVEAADAQRRRLQGELHEGAERRLVAVSAHMETLSVQVGESRAGELFGDVQEQLQAARVELSELARGIHPPALATGGLAAALPELARRAPIPVDVHADGPRGPEAIEAAAYFVCAEALANVAKYAQASRASVRVAHHDARLEVTVSDDGVGGADPNLGTGLRGLADRVEALGGRLSVESPRGAGTRLVAEIPTR
ncbi:MAG TPA: ATP-binding protein [Thermoleophilaceae bacterium]|nr:ATP-binding protein [Thermoleophilaceae bacterium]